MATIAAPIDATQTAEWKALADHAADIKAHFSLKEEFAAEQAEQEP